MQIIQESTLSQFDDWFGLVEAIRMGHQMPKAEISDTLLTQKERKYLVRSAWIPGLGACTKAVTVYPENPKKNPSIPSIQGQVLVFDETTGGPKALLDGPAETRLKTAADSALGSALLSRPGSETFLMVGAGNMAAHLIEAHLCVRPDIKKVLIWNRTYAKATDLASALSKRFQISIEATPDLDAAVSQADIISTATMSENPIIKGALLKPGSHLDLVGAYTPNMREVDDEALNRSKIFTDSFDTTINHIGEFMIPLSSGAITTRDILADYYGLISGKLDGRRSDADVTICKNGGGAHLDLMAAAFLANNLDQADG